MSVVVVSYNTRDKLRRCLLAVEREHELIVVDNASRDGSADMVASEFPDVKLIRNVENRGFGAANNQGLALATRRLKLLLNSDCYADPGAIASLAELFADERVVAAGGALRNPDGSLQQSAANDLSLWVVFCEQFGLERIFRSYWVSDRISRAAPVDQVMGACLMFNTDDRFDERFFLYCEDSDLCVRLRKKGLILYDPSSRFIHELGSSSEGEERWRAVARYNQGKELYFRIHRGPGSAGFCRFLNRCGAWLRWAAYSLMAIGNGRHRERVKLWERVLAALDHPSTPN